MVPVGDVERFLSPAGRELHASAIRRMGTVAATHADMISFAAGYPAAFFFEGGTASGNGFSAIHTTSDTLANMGNSAQNSAKFAQLGLAFLGEAAKTSTVQASKRPPLR